MRSYSHLSITTKLLLIGILSSGMALLLCSAGYMYNEAASLRAEKAEEVQLLSDILDFNLSAALTFYRPEAANEILESARRDPSVEIACVYDADGKLFAQYLRSPESAERLPKSIGEGHHFDQSGDLYSFHAIEDDGNHVGTLFILADTGDFITKMQQYGKISFIVTLCSLIVAITISIVMQRNLTRPIVELADTAQEISQGGDYSIRVSHSFRDEGRQAIRRIQPDAGPGQRVGDRIAIRL